MLDALAATRSQLAAALATARARKVRWGNAAASALVAGAVFLSLGGPVGASDNWTQQPNGANAFPRTATSVAVRAVVADGTIPHTGRSGPTAPDLSVTKPGSPGTVAVGGTITGVANCNTDSVSANESDPDPANNTATVCTTVSTDGTMCNTVTVSANENDPDPTNNSATVCTTLPTTGTTCNTVTVSANENDPDPANNTATACTNGAGSAPPNVPIATPLGLIGTALTLAGLLYFVALRRPVRAR